MPRTREAFDAMREQTRLKIEAAALSLFARKGLSVKVGEIARAAGLSQGLLYSHYPSKDALIAELARQASEISGLTMRDIAGGEGAAAEKIRQTTSMMCEMLTSGHMGIEYFMFMAQMGMSGFQAPGTERAAHDARSPVESLAAIITQGQAEGSVVAGDPVQLAIVYWAAVQGMCCYAVTGMPLWPEPGMLSRILLRESFL